MEQLKASPFRRPIANRQTSLSSILSVLYPIFYIFSIVGGSLVMPIPHDAHASFVSATTSLSYRSVPKYRLHSSGWSGDAQNIDSANTDLTLLSRDTLFERLRTEENIEEGQRVAREVQRRWLASGSPTVDVLMERADDAIRKNDYSLALDVLDAVVRLAPDFAEGWNRRAAVYFLLDNFGASLGDIARTLFLEPRHWGALSGLARIYAQLNRPERARQALTQALQINPHLPQARAALERIERDMQGQTL